MTNTEFEAAFEAAFVSAADGSTLDPEEIRMCVTEVLDALADTMPVLGQPYTAHGLDGTLQARIEILGDEQATLTVRAAATLCGKLALGWSLAGPGDPTLTDATDALSELSNIVGGSVKSVFMAETRLGIPSVAMVDEGEEAGTASEGSVFVDHKIGKLVVRLDAETHRTGGHREDTGG